MQISLRLPSKSPASESLETISPELTTMGEDGGEPLRGEATCLTEATKTKGGPQLVGLGALWG